MATVYRRHCCVSSIAIKDIGQDQACLNPGRMAYIAYFRRVLTLGDRPPGFRRLHQRLPRQLPMLAAGPGYSVPWRGFGRAERPTYPSPICQQKNSCRIHPDTAAFICFSVTPRRSAWRSYRARWRRYRHRPFPRAHRCGSSCRGRPIPPRRGPGSWGSRSRARARPADRRR